jgi:hypothetical protein
MPAFRCAFSYRLGPRIARNSMMPRKNRLKWAIPLVLIAAFVVLAKTMNLNPPTNRAQTSPDQSDADLRTRVYGAPQNEVAAKVRALQLSTYGRAWKLESKGTAKPNEITFRVPVIVFSDILCVSLQPEGKDRTRVDVESHSLVGQGDFGENRRHIKQLLRALDAALSRI